MNKQIAKMPNLLNSINAIDGYKNSIHKHLKIECPSAGINEHISV